MVIPPVQYPDLIKIINREYTDGLDRILSAQIDEEDRIVAYAQDGFKRIRVEISDTQIRFRLLRAGETAQFSESEQPDPIDPILTQLKPIGDATFTEWFISLKGLMDDSKDLVEFRDRLTDAYPDLDSAQFKSAMLDASTIAGMQGYQEASEGK
jgi:phage gp29-like protein